MMSFLLALSLILPVLSFTPPTSSPPLTYTSYGTSTSNPPIIMLHGLLGNSKNFASIAPLLSTSHSRLVISLDLPDHGSESNWGEEEEEVITYPLMSKCVVDFLDWAGIETCTVIGHSMGGKVAMAMATDPVYQGRLEGLVVIDIAPVTYEAGDGTDWSTIETIISTCTSLPLSTLPTKKSADDYLSKNIPSPSLRSFILTNLSSSKTGDRSDDRSSSSLTWKIPILKIKNSLKTLASFPPPTTPYPGDAYFITGGNSKYVRLIYKKNIEECFERYMITTIRGSGHWCHAESPADVVDLVGRYFDR
ncbi:hypothetical protein TrLO_g2903 [Triparma laevis f. longispina]|uniref:AB hydrolase-1 domain-containing protein n=1 Tax=Triparma laevis f. longispina TaxID=1714387 RepID=A0A9W7ABV9_9STRA|nr:hypothetical protein TrLO_g2903 [Triparma laevis f. longispina]